MELEERLEQRCAEVGIAPNHLENVKNFLAPLRTYHLETYEHSIRVGLKASQIAEYMHLNPKPALYGVLHDVGKSKIPLSVLDKKVGFNSQDMEVMKNHTLEGFNILLAGRYMFSAALAVSHHRFQPNCYPLILPGLPFPLNDKTRGAITLYSRIVSIADHNDALRRKNDRFGGKDMSLEEGKRIMISLNKDQERLIEELYRAGVLT
ncbi:HD domain-containing protein [Candidatus Pacearchaeota archaeon]|nr:HD domain-containing protein [Candidatus Pacearchaeota archaeon]